MQFLNIITRVLKDKVSRNSISITSIKKSTNIQVKCCVGLVYPNYCFKKICVCVNHTSRDEEGYGGEPQSKFTKISHNFPR